jgi:uncharacterized Zn finger protein
MYCDERANGRIIMKCPNCKNRKIDVYEARGYTSKESPIKECECGHVWRLIPLGGDKHRIDIIKQGKRKLTFNR